MGAATAGAGALGAVTGAVQMFGANRDKKRIAREIANQKEVPLTNIADGMQVSTLGSDLQKEEQARIAATQTSALQNGGTRAILAGTGRVSAASQDVNAQIAANLDEQQKQIDQVKAQDNGRIQATKEERQRAKLAALSSQYNAASQNSAQGLSNIISGAGMAASAFGSQNITDKTNSINKKIKISPVNGRDIYTV